MGRILDAAERFLEKDDWPFFRHPDQPALVSGYEGENGKYELWIRELPGKDTVICYSFAPHEVPEDRRAVIAAQCARINWGLIIGNFELNWSSGEVRYKTSADLRHIDPIDMVIGRLIHANVLTMDHYLPGLMKEPEGGA
jgi:hypothetical protein